MDESTGTGIGIVAVLVYLIVILAVVAAMWKIFEKAGKPGWAAIVPIYNIVILLEIIGKPVWWIVLMLIPFVNLIVGIMLYIELAKSFGKGAGVGIACIFVVGLFILGFGDATYVGPGGVAIDSGGSSV